MPGVFLSFYKIPFRISGRHKMYPPSVAIDTPISHAGNVIIGIIISPGLVPP